MINPVCYAAVVTILSVATPTTAVTQTRARDMGVPHDGRSDPLNAITDVAGITVGYTTLIEGNAQPAREVLRTTVADIG